MTKFDFLIRTSGVLKDEHYEDQFEQFADHLFEAGADDCLPAMSCGIVEVNFSRQAASLGDAIATAVRDVERAGAVVESISVEHEVLSA